MVTSSTYCITIYYNVLYRSIRGYNVSYNVLYCITLYYVLLYYAILYYTAIFCTALPYTVMYSVLCSGRDGHLLHMCHTSSKSKEWLPHPLLLFGRMATSSPYHRVWLSSSASLFGEWVATSSTCDITV